MATEFPEEESDSDLCVHRASVVKGYRAGFDEIQINHSCEAAKRTTMATEFPEEESDSDLCVHRASVVKGYGWHPKKRCGHCGPRLGMGRRMNRSPD
jgi:hypothetical protein